VLVEELHQDLQQLHPQLRPHPHHQPDVDLPNGPMINGVMMKTTMLIAAGMVVLVVTMTLVDGTLTALYVNALIPITVLQPRKPLLQPLPKPQQPLQLQLPQPKVLLLLLESVVRYIQVFNKTPRCIIMKY
jgi:hypothetical protein